VCSTWLSAVERRGNRVLRVAGRLRPGVSIESARTELSAIATGLAQEFPATNLGWGIRVVPIQDSRLDTEIRPSLLLLLGAVLVVMLIACANVSSLLVVKAAGRQRELALRAALGSEPRAPGATDSR
jgi:putative ABC transport system permease protein